MDNFRLYFDTIDYIVLGLLLLASILIGLYFAFWSKKGQNTAAEYFLGDRRMGVFPIAMSLIATNYSGVTLFGYTAEIYVYGTQIWAMLFLDIIMTIIIIYWFIPVFYSLHLTSMYEYLNKRFNSVVRTIGSILFVCKMIILIPMGSYGSALALAQISGFPFQIMVLMICLVCICYTTIGGFKAVVWTDTLQMLFMIIGVIFLPAMGTYAVGGIGQVFDISQKGERLDVLNMTWDPTVRHSFWNVLIGKFFQRIGFFVVNQGTIQRCLATPTLKKAQISLAIFGMGLSLMQHLSMYTGLVIYASFHGCDPLKAKIVRKADQLLPLFVMKISSHIPAAPGIFLSAMIGATLSTMSTGLNSMSGVIVEDLIKPFRKVSLTSKQASIYMKTTTILLGIVCTLITFLMDHVSGIVQGNGSFMAIAMGSMFGIICLGMFFPWANATGAIAGGVCSSALVAWMAFGSQMAIYAKQLVYTKKPVSIEGCSNATLTHYYNILSTLQNATTTMPPTVETPFILYRISYTWYTLIALLTTLVVGMIISGLTGLNNTRDSDPKLFSPIIRRLFPKQLQNNNSVRREHSMQSGRNQIEPLLDKP